MLDFRALALHHSMHCFFNSYIRDMNPAYHESEKTFELQIHQSVMKLKVKFYSQLGVHQFHETLSYQGSEISFLKAAELICEGSKLYSRLLNSIHNIELSLQKNEEQIHRLYEGNINFLAAEQGLLIGHSFHPSPKSRDEFSDTDLFRYAPEFHARFKIRWLLVHNKLVHEEKSETFGSRGWQSHLFRKSVPAGLVPMPSHPWQYEILKKDPVIQGYMAENLIQDAGESDELWYATSSMRSLYSPLMPFMLKFSMSVRMTNSVRHLQEQEVGRGMQIQDACHTNAGKAFSNRFPDFKILHEPAYAGIKGLNGEILPQTIVLLRENLIQESEETAVLATLTQTHPFLKGNLLTHCLKNHTAKNWFNAFMNHALVPLLVAQADYGIMLGAHQQNLMIKMKDGLPVGSYFRDCQGTGFSELGLELMLKEITQKEKFKKHLVSNEAAVSLFTYYLMINSVLNTISALSVASGESEETFIKMLQQKLQSLRQEVRDPFIIHFILSSPELNQKGNFRCSLDNLNENTASNPLSIYNNFKNPIYMESSL